MQEGVKEVPLLIERQGKELALMVAPRREVENRYMIGVEASRDDLTVKVREEWPAAKAGLQDGDVILSVGSTKVATIRELSAAISTQTVSGKGEIQLGFKRGNEEKVVSLQPRSVSEEHYTIGIEELELPPVVGDAAIAMSAYQAGIRKGDRIRSVNGVEVTSFGELARIIYAHPGETLSFSVDHEEKNYQVELIADEINGTGRIGISPMYGEHRIKRFGLWGALTGGVSQVNFTAGAIYRGLKSLFKGEQNLKKSIGGPITIFRMMGKRAQTGWRDLLEMVIMLNVMLAMLNLLPIPVVDGGEIVLAIAEGIKRRPLRVKTTMVLKQAGFIFIVLLMIFATYNDIEKIFMSVFRAQIP